MSASGLLSNFLFALLLFHYELFSFFGHFVYLIEVQIGKKSKDKLKSKLKYDDGFFRSGTLSHFLRNKKDKLNLTGITIIGQFVQIGKKSKDKLKSKLKYDDGFFRSGTLSHFLSKKRVN